MLARTSYSAVAIAFHWIIAALILSNLAVGWRMGGQKGMDQFISFQWHKSLGLTILILSLMRLGWRMIHVPPAMPAAMRPWERTAALATHWAMYLLMIVMPLTGWIIVSASPYNIPTLLYGALPWPHLEFIHNLPMDQRKTIDDSVGELHEVLAFGMAALLALHVAAALKHHFVNKDDVLRRMLPLGSRRR